MRFRILGGIEAVGDEGPITIRGRHHPKILTMLLAASGSVVPTGRLVETLWDDDPPETAESQVRNTVGALRRQLGAAGNLVETVGHGYRIAVPAEDLDLGRFDRHVAEARRARAEGRLAEARTAFAAASAEWRGPALAGLRGRLVESVAARLNEHRVTVTEERIAVALDLGEDHGLVDELVGLVAEHPLREGMRAQLMLALYRAGRQTDALSVFDEGRTALAESVGLDPGAGLRRLQARILANDPTLDPTTSAPSTAPTGRSRKDRIDLLPVAPGRFVGRDEQLDALDLLADDDSVRVAVVCGGGGVGKTALAVRWARREKVVDAFPTGALHVQLQGYSAGRPVGADEIVDQLLRQIAVPGDVIPSDPGSALAELRRRLDGAGYLVLLDNARDAAQVRPLLEAPPRGCAVVVTSRDRMTGLAFRDDVHRVSVDRLSTIESVELIRRLVGGAASDPHAVRRLASLCVGLPLAIRVAAAAYVDTHPGTALVDFVDDVAADRLSLLDVDGDPDVAMSAVLSRSTGALDAATARVLDHLGLHPGPTFDRGAAAALLDTDGTAVARALRRLRAVHLVEETAPGRLLIHDILHDHLTIHNRLTVDDRGAALDRLLGHYSALLGDDGFLVDRGRVDAEWFTVEHASLIACLDVPASSGAVVRFALRLGRQQRLWNFGIDCRRTYDRALELAVPGGAEYARALAGIGDAALMTDDVDTASTFLRRAATAFAAIGDDAHRSWASGLVAAILADVGSGPTVDGREGRRRTVARTDR